MHVNAPSLTGSNKSGNKYFLSNMQVLRFIAALMVLISHLEREIQNVGIGGSVVSIMDAIGIPWSCGVDLFFCISGFLMLYLTWDHFAETGYSFEFLKRRIIRVAPLYWLFTILFAGLALTIPSVILHGDISPWKVFASLFFIPIPRSDGLIYPVLVAGWTLNYEALFYLLFGISLFLPRRVAILTILLVFGAASAYHMLAPPALPTLFFWTNPIILEFILGMGAAYLYLRGIRFSLGIRVTLAILGVALLITLNKHGLADTESQPSPLPRSLWAGLPAILVLIAMMFGPQLRETSILARWLILGGNASYALYLSHMFATRTVSILWRVLHLNSGWGFMIAGLIVAITLSILVFKFVETPILAILRSRFEPRRALVSA